LGKQVQLAELFKDPTIDHLSELIGHGKEKLFQSLIVPLQAKGNKPALFSPHAGRGHVWCYQDLARYVDEDQPFYGIQARQPETGLVAHSQIEPMAAEYVEAIRSFQPNGPYLLCGWSMGGVIAFEMARQLQQQGQQIALLALIDSQAPINWRSNYNWAELLVDFARDVGLTQENLSILQSGSSSPSPVTQLRQVWKEAKSNGLIPSEMTLIEFRNMFDIFKINANILSSYQPGEYPGRITLFRTEQAESLKGWDKFAAGGVDLHVVPGDHFSMVREPHVKVLAEELRRSIHEALQNFEQ
ncbi:MAG TPA: thioesterase domain-containing protein, partial [Anaerolineales bacterium]|nr:thioesterase domain-containing protein [Anaerolineales bacterium]